MCSERTSQEKEAAWILYEVEKKVQEKQEYTVYLYLQNKKKKRVKYLK